MGVCIAIKARIVCTDDMSKRSSENNVTSWNSHGTNASYFNSSENSTSNVNEMTNDLPGSEFDTNASLHSKMCQPNETKVYLNSQDVQVNNTDTILYIGGLFDIKGQRASWMGTSELLSAKVAIQNINELYFLEGFSLQLLENDTQVGLALSII